MTYVGTESTVSLAACAVGRCPEGVAYMGREWYPSGANDRVLVIDLGENGALRAYLRPRGWRVSGGVGRSWALVAELRAAGVLVGVHCGPATWGHTDYYVSPAVLERLGVAQ